MHPLLVFARWVTALIETTAAIGRLDLPMDRCRCYGRRMLKQFMMVFLGAVIAPVAMGAPANMEKKKQKRLGDVVPAVNAAEIPVLAGLLDKAGWTATPELSGVFQVGRVFSDDGSGHSLMVRDCFAMEVGSDPYTSSEVVSHLRAGVRVGFGVGVKGSASLVRKVRFDVPVHHTLERLAMVPTAECAAMLSTATDVEKSTMYAIQEVLTAVITEQRCGQIDAKGRFVVAGADAEFSEVCSQESQKPVAVAYRSVPVSELRMPPPPPKVVLAPVPQLLKAPTVASLQGTTAEGEEGCHWGDIESVYATMATLTINGQIMDVRSVDNQAWVATEMQRCGHMEAAEAFNDWRDSRRTTNIACATIAGCYPFPVGIVSAVNAKKHRLRMERALLARDQSDGNE
mgnify:CR=1 FL=1